MYLNFARREVFKSVFYVFSLLLGCDAILAAINFLKFLSIVSSFVTSKRETTVLRNACKVLPDHTASAVFIYRLIKDAVSSSDYVVSFA
jgi:hypothetical protein